MKLNATEKTYYERIADVNREASRGTAPTSMRETLERMQTLVENTPDSPKSTEPGKEGDLKSHLAFLNYIREHAPD